MTPTPKASAPPKTSSRLPGCAKNAAISARPATDRGGDRRIEGQEPRRLGELVEAGRQCLGELGELPDHRRKHEHDADDDEHHERREHDRDRRRALAPRALQGEDDGVEPEGDEHGQDDGDDDRRERPDRQPQHDRRHDGEGGDERGADRGGPAPRGSSAAHGTAPASTRSAVRQAGAMRAPCGRSLDRREGCVHGSALDLAACDRCPVRAAVRRAAGCPPADQAAASAFVFSVSYSAWVMAPESSSFLADSISAEGEDADEPATLRM